MRRRAACAAEIASGDSRVKGPESKLGTSAAVSALASVRASPRRLAGLFEVEEHVKVEATWGIYQRMIVAYREPDRIRGRELMQRLIDSVSQGVPGALREVITLGRTLKRRADDVLAYFDRPGTSNGPTEAINGRLEHLRAPPSGSATSPTTSPDRYWRPAASDPDYTLDHEEPEIVGFGVSVPVEAELSGR